MEWCEEDGRAKSTDLMRIRMRELRTDHYGVIASAMADARNGIFAKYSWTRPIGDRLTAIGFDGTQLLGTVQRTTDDQNPDRRWLWSLEAHPDIQIRNQIVNLGFARTAYEAAAAIEATYDMLMNRA